MKEDEKEEGDDTDTDTDEKQRLTILCTYLLTSVHPSIHTSKLLLMENKKERKEGEAKRHEDEE